MRLRFGAWLAVALAGLGLGAVARADDQPPAGPGALLDRLEEAWARRDSAAYTSLWDLSTAEARASEAEFALDHFAAEEHTLTLQRPASFPDAAARVHAQVFSATEPRARVEQFLFRIEARGGRWRIVERQAQGMIDGLVHLGLDPAAIRAEGLTLRLPDFELRMDRGSLFLSAANLGPTVLVFVGEGQVRISPGPAAERDQLRLFCGEPELRERVRSAFVRIHPADLHRVLSPVRLDPDAGAPARWAEAQALFRDQSRRAFVLDAPLPRAPWWLIPSVGDALVSFRASGGMLTFAVNTGEPEDVSLFNRDKRLQILLYPSGGRAAEYSEDDDRAVDVLRHEIDVRFEPDRFEIRGEDALTLDLRNAATSLRLRLDDALRVVSITSPEGGNHIFFRVRGQNSLVVSLGPFSGHVGEARFVVRYAGMLNPAPVEDETVQLPGDRSELADEDLFIEKVLLYTNKNSWYPRNLSDDHAIYTARFDVPAGYSAVAGGRLVENRALDDRAVIEYRQDEPGKFLTVIVGRLVPGSAPPEGPPALRAYAVRRQRSEAEANLASARRIVEFFQREFGPCPYSFINLVITENLTPGGHSPPGLVLIQRRPALAHRRLRDDPANFSDIPDFFLAHELAHQWWGQGVAPKNYRERWLSEGVAQYAAALWIRQSRGEAAFQAVLKRFADWSLRYADAGPINLGYRLGHLRGDAQAYRAIVYDKGAYVLHMLRTLVGDEAFRRGLTGFQSRHRYMKAGTTELRQALEDASGKDLLPYFQEWVLGVSVPELRIDYRSESVGGTFLTTVRVSATGLPGPLPLLVSVSNERGRQERRVTVGPDGAVVIVEGPARPQRVQVNADRALLVRVKG